MGSPQQDTRQSRGRQILAALVTLVVIVVVFAGIFPQFANYGQAWSAITSMALLPAVALGVATVFNVIVYVWPFQAAVPGLSFGHAFVVRQTSFTISNVVPAGGALGLGVQEAMLHSYGVSNDRATAAVGVTALWNVLVTMGLPVLAMVVLLLTGQSKASWLGVAALGVVLIVVILGALTLVFRSDALARRLGDLAERPAQALLGAFGKHRELHVADAISSFRSSTVDLVRSRWVSITWTNLLLQLAQFAILFIALVGIQASATTKVTPAQALVAFALARLGSFIPITPGGLGTVDAAMTTLLSGFGASNTNAVAAVLVWRALSYFPQVFIGVATFLVWHHGRTATPQGDT